MFPRITHHSPGRLIQVPYFGLIYYSLPTNRADRIKKNSGKRPREAFYPHMDSLNSYLSTSAKHGEKEEGALHCHVLPSSNRITRGIEKRTPIQREEKREKKKKKKEKALY